MCDRRNRAVVADKGSLVKGAVVFLEQKMTEGFYKIL